MSVRTETDALNKSALSMAAAGAAVGLGFFDGLHMGHMSLIGNLIRIANDEKVCPLLYTFSEHPQNMLNKAKKLSLLTDNEQKRMLIMRTGVKGVYFDDFGPALSEMAPEEFAQSILLKKLRARCVVAGYNFRFGRNRAGDSNTLLKLGTDYKFKVRIIEPYLVDGTSVSSSVIRRCIESGDMQTASHFLGRLFSLRGTVSEGRRIGRQIGASTANIILDNRVIVPKEGAYISSTRIGYRLYKGLTNIGRNPTLGLLDSPVAETHILDFDENIYGREIEVFIHKRIRDELKFLGIDHLKARIQEDIVIARDYFGNGLRL
ncbi:MAG: bifunctional riboflavin kinase/FAD synthetase [Oscillospiraceae bacterium]|nr:bifunctional riboflavin kinase/FAD synthetase [Oscillospiraceae bacterium]